MLHIWIIRTTNGRVACVAGSEEDAKKKAEEMVAGTDATYIIIE